MKQSRIFITLITLALLCGGIGIVLLLTSGRTKQVRYVAYVGRYTNIRDTLPPGKRVLNPFDIMHEIILRSKLEELSQKSENFEYVLKTFDCGQDSNQSRMIYTTQIAPDTSIVAVLDNSWGVHLQGAAGVIQRLKIPVIAINADRNGCNFGDRAIFTGNNDNLPSDLACFITRILRHPKVNFISESDYPLHHEYLKAFEANGIEVVHKLYINSMSDSLEALSRRITDSLRGFNDGTEGTVWILNLHSKLGMNVLQFIDSQFDNVTLIGHAYIADISKIGTFGARSNNRLLLITNPTDAISIRTATDKEKFLRKHPDVFRDYNSPLFLKRCDDAVELLRKAADERRDSARLSREDVGNYFSKLKNRTVLGTDDMYLFNGDRELVQDLYFSEVKKGNFFSYPLQLNQKREVVPHVVFGLDIVDIYDIDVSHNSFKSDFYYWIKLDTNNQDAEKFILFQNMKASESTKDLAFQKISGNTLYKLYKVSGSFHANYNLRDYPFDSQEVKISVEVLNSSDKLMIAFDQSAFQQNKRLLERFKVQAWDKTDYHITVDNQMASTIRGDPENQNGAVNKFQTFSFRLNIRRTILGPFLEIILPLILIGIVAVSLLYIKDISFENLGEVSVGTFLGIITFSIALSNITPSSDYLTRADYLFWLTFLVVLVSFLSVIIINSRYTIEELSPDQFRIVRSVTTVLYPILVAWVLLG